MVLEELEELELEEIVEEDDDRLELELSTEDVVELRVEVDDSTLVEDKVVLVRDESDDEILEDTELVEEICEELTDEEDAMTVMFWYSVRPFEPPQISSELPAHFIEHRPSVAM